MKQNQEEAILSIDRDKDTEETPPEYPKDLFIKEKDDPTIFGEEIKDVTPCCVLSLQVTAVPPLESEIATIQSGQHLLKEFRRTIQFNLMMGRAEDAAKIKVIQYIKNETYRISGPNPPNFTLPTQPVGASWSWTPGTDGWTVDSRDTDRCWPNYNRQTAKHGVRRRAIWVSWYDRIGLKRAYFNEQIQNGNPFFAANRFPHVYGAEFKTDIHCTDQDICGTTPSANPTNFVVASVEWRFRIGIQRSGNQAAVLVNNAKIDNVQKSVYVQCPNSPFF